MRKILMLLTGGTIASIKTEYGLEPILDAEQILSYLPSLESDILLETIQICNLDSTNVDSLVWLKLEAAI